MTRWERSHNGNRCTGYHRVWVQVRRRAPLWVDPKEGSFETKDGCFVGRGQRGMTSLVSTRRRKLTAVGFLSGYIDRTPSQEQWGQYVPERLPPPGSVDG